jgi:hypothetical protein
MHPTSCDDLLSPSLETSSYKQIPGTSTFQSHARVPEFDLCHCVVSTLAEPRHVPGTHVRTSSGDWTASRNGKSLCSCDCSLRSIVGLLNPLAGYPFSLPATTDSPLGTGPGAGHPGPAGQPGPSPWPPWQIDIAIVAAWRTNEMDFSCQIGTVWDHGGAWALRPRNRLGNGTRTPWRPWKLEPQSRSK